MNDRWMKMRNENLGAFLAALAETGELFVPARVNDKWEFRPYEAGREVTFPDALIDVSLKSLFFPRRRPIAKFDMSEKWTLEATDLPGGRRMIMGLHPCDAAGIGYMDRVFLGSEYKDRHYEAERERTVLIGLTCDTMGPHCHCTDRNTAPDDERGLDAVFTRTEGGFLFKALTEKGRSVLESTYLEPAGETPEKREWPKGRFEVAAPEDFLEMYEDEVWEQLADICLTCGICTYECPTCVCYCVSDEKFDGKGERVTVWDSCQFSSYSRMAGGHQPRRSNASRIRNRTLDKFAYSHQKHGQISCVGCGRCAAHCPLERSFPEIAARISRKISDKKAAGTPTGVNKG